MFHSTDSPSVRCGTYGHKPAQVDRHVRRRAVGRVPLGEHLDPRAVAAALELVGERAREVRVAPALGAIPALRADLDRDVERRAEAVV